MEAKNGKSISLDYAISKVISRNHIVIGWKTTATAVIMSRYGLTALTTHQATWIILKLRNISLRKSVSI